MTDAPRMDEYRAKQFLESAAQDRVSKDSPLFFYEQMDDGKRIYNGHEIINCLNEITTQLASFSELEQSVPKILRYLSRVVTIFGITIIYRNSDTTSELTWYHAETHGATRARAVESAVRAYYYLMDSSHKQSIATSEDSPWNILHYRMEDLLKNQEDRLGHKVILPLIAGQSAVFGVLQVDCADEVCEIELSLINALTNQLSIAMDRAFILEHQSELLQREKRAIEQGMIFERQKEEAISSNTAKSIFLANMSHEIRTPLGIILGFTELMAAEDTSQEERETFFRSVQKNGELLTRLIDDILDLAKVEGGKIALEKVDFSLSEFLKDIVSTLSRVTQEKGISLYLRHEEWIRDSMRADSHRLKQILLNITNNAIKFTEQGSVSIEVAAESEAIKEYLVFRIRDTGRGISKEEAKRIFQPFMQADNSMTRQYGGTGLGLVLSRQLANAMGGDVYLEQSDLRKGSTFVVRIEIEKATGSRPLKALAAQFNADQLNGELLKDKDLLIVDDAPDNLILFKTILESQGAKVETAENGFDAINLVTENAYDAVLMDLQMPILDGLTATAELRKMGFKKPILALTALAMKSELDKALTAGCNDHLTKPLNPRLLLQKLIPLLEPPTLH